MCILLNLVLKGGGDNVYSWDCEYDFNFDVKICLNTIDTFFNKIGTPN